MQILNLKTFQKQLHIQMLNLNIKHILKLIKTTKQVQQIHANIITLNLNLQFSLLSHKSLSSNYILSIFKTIKNPSTYHYNTLIKAHTNISLPCKGLVFFNEMRHLSVFPDNYTYPFVLKACEQIKSVFLSNTIHCQILKFGFLNNVFVGNCLIHLYCVMGFVGEGFKVFDETFERDLVGYNTLLDGFVKKGELEKARDFFENMSEKDSWSWGTIIAGYAKMNKFKEAIDLYEKMMDLKLFPNNIAFVSVLSACAQLGELEKGKRVHKFIEEKGIKLDAFLGTSLVDLYAKCGCIETAMEIFESCSEKALFTWNAMFTGLAMHGHGLVLLDYLSKMVKSGIRPDGVTFLVVLVGCSHAGLVDEARNVFRDMEDVYRVSRELKHYGCMADLLSRAGLIEQAMEMIKGMPIEGDIYVWGGLLSGCRIHGDVEIAEKAADRVMEIKPEDGGVYSVLANVYANTDRWDELTRIRRLRDSTKVKKKAGCSLIELNGITHEFVSGDDLHPQTDAIYLVLDGIGKHQLESL